MYLMGLDDAYHVQTSSYAGVSLKQARRQLQRGLLAHSAFVQVSHMQHVIFLHRQGDQRRGMKGGSIKSFSHLFF